MAESDLKLFSDDLPVRLPIWHSVQSSNKKFSRMRNQFDFDVMPDYGGHMLNYDKKTDRFQQIKQDLLGINPFQIKTYLTPYRINLEITDNLSKNKFDHSECLRTDENMLMTSLSYDHPKRKELIIKMLDSDLSIDNGENIYRKCFDFEDGNIKQVNKFFNVDTKLITHIRQRRCLTVLELKKSKFASDNQLIKTNVMGLKNDNEIFFSSDQNPMISEFIIAGIHNDKSTVKLTEFNINTNRQCWLTSFQSSKPNDNPLQIKCSEFHPKMFYYSTSNDVKLFDTRYRSIGDLKIDRNKLKSLASFENFKQISNSISNPNCLFIASDYNLMLFDIRYPNYVLLQWSHMLSSDSDVSFIKNFKLEKETVFVATREEISCVSIDEPQAKNLIHPTSMHFPLHLPKLKNLIKCSAISDIHLENYINQSEIVGLDFMMINEQDFNLFVMNQYGDVFKQKFTKTMLDNPNENVMKYESNAKNMLNQNLELFKTTLLERRKEKAKEKDSLFNKPKTKKYKKPKDRKYWSKFADNFELDEDDKVKQRMDEFNNEMDTELLIMNVKSNLNISDSNELNIEFIDKLEKVFKSKTDELVSKDVSQLKWSGYTMKLFEGWNLKQDSQDEQNELTQTSQKFSEDYILSQYI